MFLKYNDEELFEFFEGDPVVIGEWEAGELLYSYEQDGFKIVLLLSTYEMYIQISICYHETVIYSQKHDQVFEIRMADRNTLKLLKKQERIIIKKEPQLGVMIEQMTE